MAMTHTASVPPASGDCLFFEKLSREIRNQIYEKAYEKCWCAVYKKGKPKYCETQAGTESRKVCEQWFAESLPTFIHEFGKGSNGYHDLEVCLRSKTFCEKLEAIHLETEVVIDEGFTVALQLNKCPNLSLVHIETSSRDIAGNALKVLGRYSRREPAEASSTMRRQVRVFFDNLELLRGVRTILWFHKGMSKDESEYIGEHFREIAERDRESNTASAIEQNGAEKDGQYHGMNGKGSDKKVDQGDHEENGEGGGGEVAVDHDEDAVVSWRQLVKDGTFWAFFQDYDSASDSAPSDYYDSDRYDRMTYEREEDEYQYEDEDEEDNDGYEEEDEPEEAE